MSEQDKRDREAAKAYFHEHDASMGVIKAYAAGLKAGRLQAAKLAAEQAAMAAMAVKAYAEDFK